MTKEERAMARAAKAAYQREWYAKHPGKRTQYNEKYWLARARKAAEAERKEENENAYASCT